MFKTNKKKQLKSKKTNKPRATLIEAGIMAEEAQWEGVWSLLSAKHTDCLRQSSRTRTTGEETDGRTDGPAVPCNRKSDPPTGGLPKGKC